MPRSYESQSSDSGETLWPVEDFDGLRYLRAVDVAVLANEKPAERAARVANYWDAIMESDEDSDDPIGDLAS